MPPYNRLSLLPGLLLAFIVGVAAYGLSLKGPIWDPLVVSMILGIFVRSLIGDRMALEPGLVFAPKFFIPLGIIFYGVNLNFDKIASIPVAIWLQVAIGIIAIFLLGDFLKRKMGLGQALSSLLNVGTAICGASAIALATPVVKAKSEETSEALLVVTIWGALGVWAFPWIQKAMGMTLENYALLCATTLHQTGFVKVAAMVLGGSCVALASSIKVARTTLIIPVLFFLSWQDGKADGKVSSQKPLGAVPWFLWVFIAMGVLSSFFQPVKAHIEAMKAVSAVLWALAMAALGLAVNVRTLLPKIGRPLVYGLLVWLVVLANYFIGYFGMGY